MRQIKFRAWDEKNKIIGYDLKQKEPEEAPKEEINERPPSNNEMIVRQNALRHAVAVVVATYEKGKNFELGPEGLMNVTLKLAEKVEEWIKRGKDD